MSCSARRSTFDDADTGDTFTYQIVGDDEADLKHGKISVSSPIARALIGKSEGDTAEVQAPGGLREYEVARGSLHVGRTAAVQRRPLADSGGG